MTLLNSLSHPFCPVQWELHRTEPEHHQVPARPPRPPSSQDHQTSSKTQGCVRLCRQLSQERVQHPYRLHSLSGRPLPPFFLLSLAFM